MHPAQKTKLCDYVIKLLPKMFLMFLCSDVKCVIM